MCAQIFVLHMRYDRFFFCVCMCSVFFFSVVCKHQTFAHTRCSINIHSHTHAKHTYACMHALALTFCCQRASACANKRVYNFLEKLRIHAAACRACGIVHKFRIALVPSVYRIGVDVGPGEPWRHTHTERRATVTTSGYVLHVCMRTTCVRAGPVNDATARKRAMLLCSVFGGARCFYCL